MFSASVKSLRQLKKKGRQEVKKIKKKSKNKKREVEKKEDEQEEEKPIQRPVFLARLTVFRLTQSSYQSTQPFKRCVTGKGLPLLTTSCCVGTLRLNVSHMFCHIAVTRWRLTGRAETEKPSRGAREQRTELSGGNASHLHRQKMVLFCSRLRSTAAIQFPAYKARMCQRSCEGHPPSQPGACAASLWGRLHDYGIR